MYSVYMHKCPDGKVYIGMTSMKVEDRWGRNGILYKGRKFYEAIEKFGWENISHVVLYEGLTKEKASEKEIETILTYKSNQPEFGYNVNRGGSGHRHSEETRKKMSATRKGRVPSESHRKALSKAITGRKASKETIEKLRISHLGYVMPESQKEKISKGCKGKGTKAIRKLSLSGEEIEVFKSLTDAINSIGEKARNGNISMCCKGKRPTAYGFRWEYVS